MKNKQPHIFLIMLTLGLFLMTTGFSCSQFHIKKPAGFAEVKSKMNTYKAISPEGIIYKIRTFKNYPPMQLDFWKQALRNQLQKEGYLLVTDGEALQSKNNKGTYFEWGVPYAEKNYIYLTALFIKDQEIVIAEAGAEYVLYQDHKAAILASLKESTF